MPNAQNNPSDSERGFKILMAGLIATTVALLILWGILSGRKEQRAVQRWLPFLAHSPSKGAETFRAKGCMHCHAIHHSGGKSGPDLGLTSSARPSLPLLVASMWNHAPQMWQRMQAERLAYPEISYEEAAQILSFLYMAGYVDELGDAERGHALFDSKGCGSCHAGPNRSASNLEDVQGMDSPAAWTQAMLNHAPEMQMSMKRMRMKWPHFEPHEFNDLLAYLQQVSDSPLTSGVLLNGDPGRGWEVFQAKSCLVCHSVKEASGALGPNLGPTGRLPATFAEMSAAMWNSMPKMGAAMISRRVSMPRFSRSELPDLMSFLHGLRYIEPSGSPQAGQTVYQQRNCSRCHGEDALGTDVAPPLRGRGLTYNSIALATVLWSHGAKMYAELQRTNQPWPILQESDIGDLIAFLNQPAKAQ